MEDRLDTMDDRLGLGDVSEEPARRGLTDFLYPRPAPRNTWGIVKWWESHRLQHNAILGFEVLASIYYLLGPTVGIAIEKISRGKILPTVPALFRMGLTFSAGLTLLPTLMATMD